MSLPKGKKSDTDVWLESTEDFGQKVDLSVRIREILRNYPEGLSILKELIQNADDANARTIRFCSVEGEIEDQNNLEPSSNLSEYMSCSPSLLVNNDAMFTETDFASIQRIGDSLKKSSGNKTGRFGVGVNAVYHLTDVPMFVSGKKVVLFDPQCSLIPGLNPANPGKLIKIDNESGRKVIEALPAVFFPLKAFGCNLNNSFHGTTFRFSLRTKKQAEKSKLSSQCYSLSALQSLLSDLSSEASLMMLFLKNIEVIEVYHWARGKPEPSLLTRTAVKTSTRLRQKRAYMLQVTDVPSRSINIDYILETSCEAASSTTNCKYIVCNQYGGGNASKMATSKDLRHMNLVPWAGVAAKLSDPVEGQVYCFLPLPVHTNLPVHVNGYFELSSNRRDIWWGSDMAGDGLARAQWNQSLLLHVAAPCYARLIQSSIQNKLISSSAYESFFPIHPKIVGPWSVLQKGVFALIPNVPILYSTNQSWVTPKKSWSLPDHAPNKLTKLLEKEGVPLVLYQNALLKELIQQSCGPNIATPSFIRQHYKTSPSKVLVTKDKLDYGLFLLEYCLQDLEPQKYSELSQCPLLPLANGDFTMFRQLLSVNISYLEQLMGMGFTRVNTLHALRICNNDLDTAMEWLMQHTHFEFQPKIDPCLLLQGVDEDDGSYKDLFQNHQAADFLIAAEHITSKSSLRKFFYCLEVQRLLNILVITDVADIMTILLCNEWINVQYVKVEKVDILWFKKLWKFLLAQICSSSSASFEKIAEVYCILPTKQNYICPLSATASILDGKLLSEDIRLICNKLGCRSLHPELWDEVPKELNLYIHQGNKNGVVRAIETASRRCGNLFSLLDKEEKMKLLDYLLNSINDDSTKLHLDSIEAIKYFTFFPYFHNQYDIEYAALKDRKSKTKWSILSNFVEADKRLMTSDFLCCQALDEKKLLSLFGDCVKLVSRSQFIRHYILPRINSFMEDDLLYIMRNILVQLPSLIDEDKELENILKLTPFILCAGEGENSVLKAPLELFDPSITLLTSLMDIGSFPHEAICKQPNMLVSLRNLGLQSTLSWDNLLGVARSIEQQCLFDKQPESAKIRACELLSYFDAYALTLLPDLFPVQMNKNKSFFQKLYDSVVEDQEQLEKEKRKRAECIQKLLRIQWVPVCTNIPLEGSETLKLIIPLKKKNNEEISVAAPLDCTTKDRIWFLSYKKRIVYGEVHTPELRRLFTWDDPFCIEDVAVQLKMLSQFFQIFRDDHHEDQVMMQEACQALSAEIPRFYSVLNRVSTSYEEDILKNVLHDSSWLWIGNNFISSNDVAFSSPYSIIPYLYTVPVDLRCYKTLLKNLGVREAFGPSDFCHVLHRMSCSKNKLSVGEIELAINLVQSLSDYTRLLPDLDVYAPSDNGFVFSAMKMVYDDAAWLTKNIQENVIFVHPKVSILTAKKIGCKSLRGILYEKNTDMLQFGDENEIGRIGEAFGQSESLTRRLRNIVEMYPEGPQQLSELIQNADDANASLVKFLITTKRHKTDSLLSKSLEEWQGPSLIVYNDSKFTSSDFYNISRIGQASKLDRLNTTGRFGLGFNSVFHWTDCPSIVSGDFLVMLDPHEKYVPGATTAARGIKIRFRDSNLVEQFPDQMNPYLVFGCNMKDAFEGTLFRFPFRNEKTAKQSEISKTCWDAEAAENLLSSFKSVLNKYLLFLRHVKRIEVYGQSDTDNTPKLLYYAEVSERIGLPINKHRSISSANNDWNSVSNFITGGNKKLSKDSFFSLLQRTAPSRLPRTQHLVKIKFEEVYPKWSKIFHVTENESCLEEVAVKISNSKSHRIDEYLICTALGGVESQKMTLQYKDMKLLPWGGVAAHIRENGEFVKVRKSGNAFCFLPLPCETGLPIHVNGYFELSSNRRDIWYGDDMTGSGQIRSQWNRLLLSDVISPLYARLLLLASSIVGQGSIYYHLFPTSNSEIAGGEVWRLLRRSLHLELAGNNWKVFYSPLHDGTWVSLKEALAIAVENDEDKRLISERTTSPSLIIPILIHEQLKVVPLPLPNLQAIKEHTNDIQEVSPSYVRDWFRHKEQQHELSSVIKLLKYSLQDLNSNTYQELSGLKWIPMLDGDYGAFNAAAGTSPMFFVCNELEKNLLSQSWNRLVNIWTEDEVVNGFLKKLTKLSVSSSEQRMNVKQMEIGDFVNLLSSSFPPEWQDFMEVRWTPTPLDDSVLRPRSDLWMKNLWQYLIHPSTSEEEKQDNILPYFVNTWQILPTIVTDQNEKTLCKLVPNRLPIVSPIDSSASIISEKMMNVLQEIGIRIIDIHSFLPSDRHAIVTSLIAQGFIQKPTTKGVLQAMINLYGQEEEEEELRHRMGKRFKSITSKGKECLFNFFSDFSNWKEDETQQLVEAQVKLLRSLPIFPIYSSSSAVEFASITHQSYLAPTSADNKFLNETFFKVSSQNILLDNLGVKKLNDLEFYSLHVCPKLTKCSLEEIELSIGKFLEQFPKYLQEVDEDKKETWIKTFSTMSFMLNQQGDLARPIDLYDVGILSPSIQELLDDAMLPRKQVCASYANALSSLRLLGIKSELSPHGILEAAKRIEAQALGQGIKAKKRGMALLNFLDSEDTLHGIFREISNDSIELLEDGEEYDHEKVVTLDSDSKECIYFNQLSSISWLPIETRKEIESDAALRPPTKIGSSSSLMLAAPKSSRPKADEWLCSATMDIVSSNIRSDLLNSCLGWNRPLPVDVLCVQLLSLSKMHSDHPKLSLYQQQLASIIPRMYAAITEEISSNTENKQIVTSMLSSQSIIWIGNTFLSSKQIAFEAPDNARPYLVRVPPDLLCFEELLRCCGVRERFHANDFVKLTMDLSVELNGSCANRKQLDLAIGMAKLMSRLPAEEIQKINKNDIFLPSSDGGKMYHARSMIFNDAPWLPDVKSIRHRYHYVHEDVGNETARILGSKSLRDVLAAKQNGMIAIPCPKSDALTPFFSQRNTNSIAMEDVQMLFSIIEIAEILNVKHLSILFDYRSHKKESLLHPLLAQAQGPAINICFHGVVMTVEKILRFMTPSKYYQERAENCSGCGGAGFPRFGCGLIASFFFSNCVQILSGNQLIFFDPTGEHFFDGSPPLSTNTSDHNSDAPTHIPSTKPQTKKKAVARNYGLSMEMLRQFPDQIEPFSSLPFGVRESLDPAFTGKKQANFHGTLFRLPLRSHESSSFHSFCENIFTKERVMSISHELKKKVPTCFLFTQYLQTMTIHEWLSSEEKDDEKLRQILSSHISSSPFQRKDDQDAINNNKTWKKSASKFSLFKGNCWEPVLSSKTMKISNLFDENKEEIVDTYLIQSILAPLKLRDMACTDVLKSFQLLPVISLAARIHQDDNNNRNAHQSADFALLEEGTLFVGLDTGISTGLPFFINAPLFLHEFKGTILLKNSDDADMREQFPRTRIVKVKQHNGDISESFVSLNVWNMQSLACVMQQYIPGFLQLIRDHIQHSFEDDLRLFYKFWPFFSGMSTFLQELISPISPKGGNLYQEITKSGMPLYLTNRNEFKSIQDGCFECTHYPTSDSVTNYFKSMISMFTVPFQIIEDLTRFGVKMKQLTPSFARHVLKVQGPKHAAYLRQKPKEALELLEFCLADIVFNDENGKKICSELQGLCLMPLADGTVGTIGRTMILATLEQQMLLPCLREKFVFSLAAEKLKRHPMDMLKAINLSVFSPKILADHISKILPSAWKGKNFVSWDFVERYQQEACHNQNISRLWLSLFWKEVKLWDHDNLSLFKNWPLIPVKSGELASCNHARFILYFSPGNNNDKLQNTLLEEYKAFQEDCVSGHMYDNSDDIKITETDEDEAFRNMGRRESHESQTAQTLTADNEDNEAEESNDEIVTSHEVDNASISSDNIDGTVIVETTTAQQIEPSLTSTEVKTLDNFLMMIRCPLLETTFFDVEDLRLLLPPDRLSVSRSILATLNQCIHYWINISNNDPSVEEPRLLWSALRSQELDELLLFLVKHQGARLSLMPSDLAMIKTLPLFESISHDRLAIINPHDYFLLEESVDVSQISQYLPDSARRKILLRKPDIQDIFEDLDIATLTEADVLQRFVLEIFSGMSFQQKEAACQTILSKWSILRNNPSFIDALRETPFVKRYAKNDAFDGQQSNAIEFVKASDLLDPNNEFLHSMLKQTSGSLFPAEEFLTPEWLGILSEVGLKNRVDCDTFLKCAKNVEDENDINLSMKLFSYFTEHVNEFMDRDFHRKLSYIKCVPAELNGGMALLRFRDVAVSKDRDIVFTAIPVCPEIITPPQILFSNLGVISPPHLATVLSHLRSLTEEGDQLDRWSYKYGSIEQVFSKIFFFLQENYNHLSPRVCEGLSNRAIVPVGTTLVKGNRLFIRLGKDLAPLFFEVPRAFGAYDAFLHNIGVKDSPSQEDYASLLHELKHELGDSKLNVNELNSIVDILELIVESKQPLSSAKMYRSLCGPNIYGTLIELDALIQNDLPRLVNTDRLNLEVCHLVHPKLSETVCETLRVSLLSKRINEQLDDTFEIEYVNDTFITALERNLRSREFIFTISQLVKNESAVTIDENVLKSLQVFAVKRLRTRFFLSNPDYRHGKIDVTNDTEGSLYYLDKLNKRLLIAINDFPAGVSSNLIVAFFLCDHFGLDRGNVAGLSAMLSSDVTSFASAGKVLGVVGSNTHYDELRRGEAGTLLLSTDLDLIELKPLKVFNKNEIVALKESDESSNLLYGIIKEGGGGSSLSRLKVIAGKGKEITKLSTEIYSFRGGDKRPRRRTGSQNLNSLSMKQSLSAGDDMESALTFHDELGNSLPPVDRDDLLNAVQDLLKSIDMSLNDNFEDVLKKNLMIRDELNHKDQHTKSLENKIETMQKDITKAMDAFLCPITREIMTDPVICADGHTYERHAIEQWLRSNSRSPQTNNHLSSRVLIPNHAMRNAIESMRHQACGSFLMNA